MSEKDLGEAVQVLIELLKVFGPMGMMAWFMYYTITKVMPDKETQYKEERKEQSERHIEQVNNLVTSFKEDLAVEREFRKNENESIRRSITDSFTKLTAGLIAQNIPLKNLVDQMRKDQE